MSLNLTVTHGDQDSWRILGVSGEIDIATIGELEAELNVLMEQGASLVLDLTGTEFMDSSGLRLIVSTHNRLAEMGGRLVLAVEPGPIARLLDVTGLRETLDVRESVDDVLGS